MKPAVTVADCAWNLGSSMQNLLARELEQAGRGNKTRQENLAKANLRAEPHLKFVLPLKPLLDQARNGPICLLKVIEGRTKRGSEPIAFAPDPARGIENASLIPQNSSHFPRMGRPLAALAIQARRAEFTPGSCHLYAHAV